MLLSATDEVVLSDFGIAVVQQNMDSLSTQSQAGTPLYMAPEQIQRKPCAASDQYALGVLVYEWLCGEPPFRGSLFEVLSQHLYHPPPSLCARLPSLLPAVEDAVFGALAKEPHARFASVQEFAEVLEAVCEATQTLSLRVSSEHFSRGQTSPPEALAASVPVPSLQEQDRCDPATQPIVVVRQHTEDTEEPVALQVRPPTSQTNVSSGREGVAISRANRKRLLRKVRAYWIAGVFEHSLHWAALLTLGLEEQPDALSNPWQLELQHPAGAPRPLPTGTHITEVYDAAEGELLILGAPGSGKTTLLLELARDLLSRAEHDEQHPLPVVFNLSSWASKQQPLTDWLVEELNHTYQVPRSQGQAWVDSDQILPLLDGLDEVAPTERTACIETINTYRQEHGLLPIVVSSRSADYLTQSARVGYGGAVAVLPLTQQQVESLPGKWRRAVMGTAGGTASRCCTARAHKHPVDAQYPDDDLPWRVRRGAFTKSLTYGRAAAGLRALCRTHAQTSGSSDALHASADHALALAATQQMKQRNQTVFYIEYLQPDWLGVGERRRYLLYRLTVGYSPDCLPDCLLGWSLG